MVYLLYIGIFTLCCTYRPLKDAPENYTNSQLDKTIRVQKTLKVCGCFNSKTTQRIECGYYHIIAVYNRQNGLLVRYFFISQVCQYIYTFLYIFVVS